MHDVVMRRLLWVMRERGTPLMADPVAPFVWQLIFRFWNNACVAKKGKTAEVIRIVVYALAASVVEVINYDAEIMAP
ncbi:MAG: hypothetical protein ACKPKO_09150 [Candidatus Fonsibacter sp.]